MTRHDFRVKVDLSRVFEDARQYSFIFVDSTKIFKVSQLADRVQKIFDVKQPFYLLSTHQDTNVFLPFNEDVRVLENNDTVLIIPGTGISENNEVKRGMNYEELENDISCKYKHPYNDSALKFSNGFEKEDLEASKASQNLDATNQYMSDKSYLTTNNTINKTDLAANSLYRTALHDTMEVETTDSKLAVNGDNSINSFNEDSLLSVKRKRVRSRKKKTKDTTVSESDASMNETNIKKPKVVSSVLLSSGKHIRFEGLDDESDELSESNNSIKNTSCKVQVNSSNGVKNNNGNIKNDLSNLLSMGQSSTPLTFSYKKPKKEVRVCEKLAEASDSMEYQNSSIKSANGQDNQQFIPPATPEADTYSFKVFRISENYTPQVSSVILGRVLSRSKEGSQLTMKILHGKDQLRDPEGKFALPKEEDEEDEADKESDIITIEKEKLLEFTKIKAMDTSL